MNDVQQQIAELREKGWTIAAIADELDTHRETVARWVSGQRYPEHSKAISALLDTLSKRKRIPKRRRYEGTHHLQRKAIDSQD